MNIIEQQIEKFYRLFAHDLGIDLGTANTLVYVRGQGILVNEPSVVAINQKTGRVVAVGNQAKAMLGRTPPHISAVRPLVEGVISDFEVTEEMISYLISKVQQGSRKFFGPRVVVGVPSGVTNVESRAVRDATRNSGAREVHIVEQPMAAAIGIRLPVKDPMGNMIIDIGGGTTDIAVISLGGMVRSKNLKLAGDHFNNDIIGYIRNEFKILIGEKTAEQVKISIGSVAHTGSTLEAVVKGRDLVTGLPREVVITDADIREAIGQSVDTIIEAAREVLETTPPELVSDIMQRGIFLVGGGALLRGLAPFLEQCLKIPVQAADDPLTAVARGAGIILEDMEEYRDTLISHEEDISSE